MPSPDPWDALDEEFDRWRREGRTARLWLRDDDAREPSPALDRLLNLCAEFDVPLLLAVIPTGTGAPLARRLEQWRLVSPCQHGFAHANHAPKDEKAAEFGPHRSVEILCRELSDGRRGLLDLFGEALLPVLVPPWNRITPQLLPHLPDLGFEAVSTFGFRPIACAPGLRQVNCHVDIIDWKGTRGGHDPVKLVGDLVEALAFARGSEADPAVGVLTHHLAHDENAWRVLDDLFRRLHARVEVRWVDFRTASEGALAPASHCLRSAPP